MTIRLPSWGSGLRFDQSALLQGAEGGPHGLRGDLFGFRQVGR
jgi:hypothetical protein